jgi:hypothetical protein
MITTTWRRELTYEMSKHGEIFSDITRISLSEEELDEEFDCCTTTGYSTAKPLYAWTNIFFYFHVRSTAGRIKACGVPRMDKEFPPQRERIEVSKPE